MKITNIRITETSCCSAPLLDVPVDRNRNQSTESSQQFSGSEICYAAKYKYYFSFELSPNSLVLKKIPSFILTQLQ